MESFLSLLVSAVARNSQLSWINGRMRAWSYAEIRTAAAIAARMMPAHAPATWPSDFYEVARVLDRPEATEMLAARGLTARYSEVRYPGTRVYPEGSMPVVIFETTKDIEARLKPKQVTPKVRECAVCGGEFKPKGTGHKTCSAECRKESNRLFSHYSKVHEGGIGGCEKCEAYRAYLAKR